MLSIELTADEADALRSALAIYVSVMLEAHDRHPHGDYPAQVNLCDGVLRKLNGKEGK
jgi:hypothetical protein